MPSPGPPSPDPCGPYIGPMSTRSGPDAAASTGAGSLHPFACPVCGLDLGVASGTARCGNAHAYDVAREGYVNLLLAQHRRSRDPGYSREMLAARRLVFDTGLYRPLADELGALVLGHLAAGPPGAGPVVLDAGCGEGYYLRRLRSAAPTGVVRAGLDISKHGVRMAARLDPGGRYAVAGTHRMPVGDGTVAVLLTHFSPVSPDDFRRVVAPGGTVLVGGPGPDHLGAIKALLYDHPVPSAPTPALDGIDGFEPAGTHRLTHPLHVVGATTVAALLAMTPWAWSADAPRREVVAALDGLDTVLDVVVRAYRRAS